MAALVLSYCAVGALAHAADTIAGDCEPPPGPERSRHATIQQAVDAAGADGTVVVCPGAYPESVIVRHPGVQIASRDGADATTVSPAPTALPGAGYFGFEVLVPDVTIGRLAGGFTIGPAGIPIDVVSDARSPLGDASRARVEGNRIVGFREVGISIGEGADGVVVTGNEVRQTSGLLPGGSAPLPGLGSVPAPLAGPAAIALNSAGGASPPTRDASIVNNDVIAPPGLAGDGEGAPAASSISVGIAVWNAGGRHTIAGNEVTGAGAGVSFGEGVAGSTVSGNRVAPELGEAPASAPEPIHVGVDDPNGTGVYALDRRNLWFDNHCSSTYQAAEPEDLCTLEGPPPVPTGLTPAVLVEGITTALKVRGAAGNLPSTRIKAGGDPGDAAGYDAFAFRHFVTAPAAGVHRLHVQATNPGSGHRPVSHPVTFEVPVVENHLPAAAGDEAVELDEDSSGRTILLGHAGNEPEEMVFLRVVDAASLSLGRLEGLAANGRVIDPVGAVTYVPDRDAHGSEAFRFVACDGFARPGNPDGCSAPRRVRVDVAPVNDRPTASPATLSFSEDRSASLELSGSDVETPVPDDLVYQLVGTHGEDAAVRTAKGRVVLEGRRATYTPDPDANGADSFSFTVRDDGDAGDAPLTSEPAGVTVTIEPVQDAPTAAPVSARTDEDVPVELVLRGDDPDAGDPLAYSVVRPPAHGRVAQTADHGVFAYEPDPDFHGVDSFAYRVTDAAGDTAEAEVDLEVASINDAPELAPAALDVEQGGSGTVALRAIDVDGDAIELSVAAPAEHGTATVSGETATYAPAPGFVGADRFAIRASDPAGAAAYGEVAVTVRSLPLQPLPPLAGPPAARGPVSGLVVVRVGGRVTIAPRGGRRLALVRGQAVPAGARIDARRGTVVVAIRGPAGPGGVLQLSRGVFAMARTGRLVELRLRGTGRLDVVSRCRCRVVTAEATVDAFRSARWRVVRRAAATRVLVVRGRIRVLDRARVRWRWLSPRRRATVIRRARR